MERRKRRLWTRLVSAAAILILLAAGLSLGFRFLVDAVPGYRGKVETAVGAAIGRPVRIGAMALTWSRLRPTLEFRDLAVLDPATRTPLLSAAHLRMGTGFSRLLSGETLPSWIDVSGVAVDADIAPDGRWSIRGIDLATDRGGGSPLKNLDRIDRIRITDAHFELRDARLGPQARLQPLLLRLDRAELHRSGQRYRLEAALRPPQEIAQAALLHAAIGGAAGDIDSWTGEGAVDIDGIRGWPWLQASLPSGTTLHLDRARAGARFRIEAGRIVDGSASLGAATIEARHHSASVAALRDLDLAARFERVAAVDSSSADGWKLAVERLALSGKRGAWPAQTGLVELRPQTGAAATGVVQLQLLRLDDVLPWVALFVPLPSEAQRAFGDVTAIEATIQPRAANGGTTSIGVVADAQLHGIGLAPQEGQPSLSGLDGALHVESGGDGNGGRLTLADAAPTLSLPELFTQPLALRAVGAELEWRRQAGETAITARHFAATIENATAQGSLDLRLSDTAGTPARMKLVTELASPDAAQLKGLMPLTWGEKTREWLGRALVKGRVSRGHLVVDGPLVPRNEAHPDGTPWSLELDVVDGQLAFHPDWPPAENMAAHLSFRDHGLRITSDGARIDGVPVQRVDATIDDFRDSPLLLDGRSTGLAEDYYRLLRDSPLRTRLAALLTRTEASGPAALKLHLDIPLHVLHIDVQANGTVVLGDETRGAQLAVHGLAQPIEDVRGELDFARNVSAENLGGRAFGTPLRVAIRPEAAPDGSSVDTLSGEFEADTQDPAGPLTAYVPGWLRGALSGRGVFHLRLPFSGPDSGRVTLASDLRGITSALPPPLGKTAEETLPLSVRIGGAAPAAGPQPLRVLIAAREDAVRVALRLVTDDGGEEHTRGVQVRLGPGETPTAEADGIVVDGRPEELDGPAWSEALAAIGTAGNGPGALQFRSADLAPGRLRLGPSALHGVRIVARGVPEGVQAALSGADAEGSVEWLRGDGGQLRMRLQRLALEAATSAPPSARALVDAAEKKDETQPSIFDPNKAPVLDVEVGALSVGGIPFGRLQLATARIDGGQRLDALTLAGGKLDLEGGGRWQRVAQQSSATATFDLSSSDVGEVLGALGYTRTLSAQRARFAGQLDWPRRPAGLELALARGELHLDVAKGSLKAVEPGGTGRVLGLINLYALPRRLLLDFRDVAGQGLGFDTLKGSFRLADGQATTDDLDIVNPSLKIELRGRIGLAARDYDQRVTVRPDFSTGVTVGATLLGGPIAGGIALVVQQLAGKPLSALTQYSYRVTGSWDDPQIDKAVDKSTDKATDKATDTGDKTGETRPAPAKGVPQ